MCERHGEDERGSHQEEATQMKVAFVARAQQGPKGDLPATPSLTASAAGTDVK